MPSPVQAKALLVTRQAVMGAPGVSPVTPGAPITACPEEHRPGVEGMNFPRAYLQGYDATGLSIIDQQIEHEVFVEEAHLVLHRVLVHRLQDHVPGAVGGVAGTAYRSLAKVACMSAEAALVDTPIGCAVEWQATMFQFVDGIDRFTCQDLGRGLIYQVVAALDGIVHMPLPVVFFHVAQRGRNTSLGGSGV